MGFMYLVLIIISFSLSLACVFCCHKIYRVHLMLFEIKEGLTKSENNLYFQLESLVGLYRFVPESKVLPALRGWAGSPDYLLEMARQVTKKNPKVVVECGSGASSVVIGHALKNLGFSGRLYSLEHDRDYVKSTESLLEEHGLLEWVSVIYAPLVEYELDGEKYIWYSLDNFSVENIDILNIDGPPTCAGSLARYPALPLLKERFSEGALVIMDDSRREEEKVTVRMWSDSELFSYKVDFFAEKGMSVLYINQS